MKKIAWGLIAGLMSILLVVPAWSEEANEPIIPDEPPVVSSEEEGSIDSGTGDQTEQTDPGAQSSEIEIIADDTTENEGTPTEEPGEQPEQPELPEQPEQTYADDTYGYDPDVIDWSGDFFGDWTGDNDDGAAAAAA